MTRRIGFAPLAALLAASLSLAACGVPVGSPEGPTLSAPAAKPSEPGQPVSGAELVGHIHNLGYDGRALLIGTHEGLWVQDMDGPPALVAGSKFDVMGLTLASDRWFTSGHPGSTMAGPESLGLLKSTDQGRTWTAMSLSGEADFHRLANSGDVVVGLNSRDGALLRSEDGGMTWTELGAPRLHDLAISQMDSTVIVGTSESGPVRSADSGFTFQPIAGAPLLVLLAWAGDTLFGADVDGQVVVSGDGGLTWSPRGSLPAQPGALAATKTTVAAHVGDTIYESIDGGRSFTARIAGIAGH